MIEHLKETNTNWHNSHSFGMNFGSMMSFGMNPAVGSGMMAAPVVRNEKGYSIEETLSKSGIYAKEKTIKIGNVIEITPTLRNEEKISVFDTSIINSIGGIASGVQEIKENWEAIQKPHHDIIIDAEPVDVVQEHKEEKTPVIADVEPKIPEKQENFSIRQDELHEIIDEIYYEDIAPYHEFERAGSPDRVETELTKAVEKVQDVANGLANASDFSNMPDPIISADSDPQSMVALGKGVMKVTEFAGTIFGTVIEPAANAIGTKVRRILRDDLSVIQAKAQDIGDITHVVAGILIPGGTAKVISKTGKLTSFGKATKRFTKLDFIGCKTQGLPAYKHIEIEHAQFHPEKIKNGVFYGDPKQKIELAWQKVQELKIEPTEVPGRRGILFDHYIIPFENAGYEYSGGLVESFARKTGGTHPVIPNTNCDYIIIVVEKGTNRLKDAYPVSSTMNIPAKEYLK